MPEACLTNIALQEADLLGHDRVIHRHPQAVSTISFVFDPNRLCPVGHHRADNIRPCTAESGNADQFRESLLTKNPGNLCLERV